MRGLSDFFSYYLGKVISVFTNCYLIYLQKKNTCSVNNGGSVISSLVRIQNPKNVYIGKNSYVNGGYLFASKNAKIIIGDNVLISYNVHLRTSSHNYLNKNILINEQGECEKDIIIGNDVWLGFGSIVLPGVTVADGCVIGAGAVVTKNTLPYGVYVGCPAKLLKYRN